VVVIDDVSVVFESHDRSVVALDHVSLRVAAGEFLCLVGPSGSGKSTLLRVIAGLLPQTSGSVHIAATRPDMPLTAMVFQEHALLPWRTVLANVAFGPENRGVPRRQREAHAREMLALVGLSRFAQHFPHQLSGGMKQRVGIARALANDPEVLLMDEPFAALDAQTRGSQAYGALLEKIWSQLRDEVVRAMGADRGA
jgi:NitT/TauT family transport system ATP-binding protein